MTVAPAYTETTYSLTGANLGPFATVWTYEQGSDVNVTLIPGAGAQPVTLNPAGDYALTALDPAADGGTALLSASLLQGAQTWPAGATLILAREVTNDQPSAFGASSEFDPAESEDALDHVQRQVQELKTSFARTVQVPTGEAGVSLPAKVLRATQYATYDIDGQPSVAPSINVIQQLIDAGWIGTYHHPDAAIAATAGQTIIGVTDPVASASLLYLEVNGVPQRPDVDYTVDGSTTVTLTEALSAGDFYWYNHLGGRIDISDLVGVTSPEAHWQALDADWTNAWTRALATGKRVVGDITRTYAISSTLALPQSTRVQDARFKWTGANPSNRICLSYGYAGYCELDHVTVDLNGDGSGGSFASAAAIWITGAVRVKLNVVEVTGNNCGTGIRLTNCLSGEVISPYIHDITGGTPTTTNPGNGADQIAGIWLDGSSNLVVIAPRIYRLYTQWSGQAPKPANTRGVTTGGGGTGGGKNCTIVYGDIQYVDEAYDITGDQVPTSHKVIDSYAAYCRTFGFKMAVSTVNGRVIRGRTYRIGLCAYVAASTSVSLPDASMTHDVRFEDCIEEDTGYNLDAFYSGQSTFGFKCESDDGAGTWPRGVTFDRCNSKGGAYLRAPFSNQAVAYTGADRNRAVRCSVGQYTGGVAFDGFLDGFSTLGREANQTIPSNINTKISFDRAFFGIDGFGFLPGTGESRTPTTDLVAPYATMLQFDFVVAFVPGADGDRGCFMQINGVTVAGGKDFRNAAGSTDTTPRFSVIRKVAAGDVLTFWAYQDNAGSVAVDAGDLALTITDLDPDRVRSYV